jgi:hypothetical protein
MIGEPVAGNPHARFDEGRQETCVRARACLLLYGVPHQEGDLFLLDLCGNKSAGV